MTRALLSAAVRIITGVHSQPGLAPAPHGRIYFANHTSNLDFLVIWAALPGALRNKTRPVAAADYWQSGVVRPLLAKHVFRAVLIPRKEISRADNPLDLMSRALREGADLILFPEGTRSRSGVLQPFKGGIHHLARAFPQVELVPVGLENLSRILPAGEFLPVPLIARVRFGEPLKPLEEGESRTDFLARCRDAVAMLSGSAEAQDPR